MQQLYPLISILTLSAILAPVIPSGNQVTFAQKPKECFWVGSSRQVVNFPSYMCGSLPISSETQRAKVSAVDKAFIADYLRLAELQEEPIVRTLLARTIENSPTSEINEAKQICSALSSGSSLKQVIDAQAKELAAEESSAASKVNIRLAVFRNALAIKHYCPQFSSQLGLR